MSFKKKIPYKLKTLVPALGMAGASLFMGCTPDKYNEPIISETPTTNDQNTPQPETPTDPRVKNGIVELYFSRNYWTEVNPQEVYRYQYMPDVDSIYLIPENGGISFAYLDYIGIDWLRRELEPLFRYSKARGKGELYFWENRATPSDSLWFVNHGWIVNKRFQQQR